MKILETSVRRFNMNIENMNNKGENNNYNFVLIYVQKPKLFDDLSSELYFLKALKNISSNVNADQLPKFFKK